MEQIGARDTGALLDAIRAVSELGDLDTYACRVIREVGSLVPSDYVSYNEVDPPRLVSHQEPDVLTDELVAAFTTHAHEHPLVQHHARTGDGAPVKFSDLMTRRELHRLGIYDHFFRELGVEYQIAIGLPAPRPIVIGLALSRAKRDYTERDRTVLQLMRPHLVQAYRNAQIYTALRESYDAVIDGLASEGRFMVLVHEGERIEWLQEETKEVVLRYFPSRDQELSDTIAMWMRTQRGRLEQGDALPQPAQPLVVERDGRRLILRYVHGEGPDILICDERPLEPDAAPLQSLGLSAREAEVLLAAARGGTNDEIAANLGVSRGTVKKHLGNVYRKLGVSNRAAATAHAFETMALAPRP